MSQLLDDIYSSLPQGADASTLDRQKVEMQCGKGSATYGEITSTSSSQLLLWLKLKAADCFVDCGSGVGRLVLQACIETDVGQAIGVEMSTFRHEIALQGQEKLQALETHDGAAERATFLEGDFRNLMPVSATVIYAGSLCFPDHLMNALARAACSSPDFRILCTLKKLPEAWIGRFEQLGELDLEMTWSRNNRVYVYGRKRI